MEPAVAGIDVSKKTFDVALLRGDRPKNGRFKNTLDGFVMFGRWLRKEGVEGIHVCMEATGTYGEQLAEHLYEAGYVVSVVNPARIKGFAQSELTRTKTDKADAGLIARFCRAMRPEPWQPPTPEIRKLQALVRRLAELNGMLNQERNRLDTADDVVKPSIADVIKVLEEHIKHVRRLIRDHIDSDAALRGKRDLLESIPGIGPATSAMILGEFGDVARFRNAKRMASFCGLAPRHRQSGSSVRGKSMLSKTGSSRIRKALYMPALVAMSHNPLIRGFCARPREGGKCSMVIIAAAMRKLVHIIYGVLKNGRPFDPAIGAAA